MIAAAWTLTWSIAPFALFPAGLYLFGTWLRRRTDGEGFAAEFVSHACDVAAIEADLPTMAVRR